MSQTEPAATRPRRGTRWLLFGSLALNLFFIGIAVALAVRASEPRRWHRDVFVRTERLASTLPKADAAILLDQMKTNRTAIANAQTRYRDSRDDIRAALRQEPFSEQSARTTMAANRAARQKYDEVLHGVFADAAAKMSPEGRHAMADYRISRRKPKKDRQ
jgi:uncharacterized membrane protein